jgi:erythrocyte band 7 integral membrane protein
MTIVTSDDPLICLPIVARLPQVLTKDSVTVSVDAVVYFRVSNATVSVANVENAHHSTRLLAQTTLRNILGTKDLHEILGDRETISGSMQAVCAHITFHLNLPIFPRAFIF